uniref:Uncharacterized protein n=1 Tax=Podarcis muralis TaxID=64176 RepID=A0A670KIW4_PODMU
MGDEEDGKEPRVLQMVWDHTLGNSLRYMIMKNPEKTCSKINLRIQTKGGLPDLMGVCQHVLSKFEASMEECNAQKDVTMEEA